MIIAGSAYFSYSEKRKSEPIHEYTYLVPLAREIKQIIKPQDHIFVFPDDEATANLYYLLQCSPPRFWIFHYPWFLSDGIKRKIILTLETDRPEWIVYFPHRWEAEKNAPEVMDYLNKHYRSEISLDGGGGKIWLLRRLS